MIFPLRFRRLGAHELLFANDAGDFFAADDVFLDRYVSGALTDADHAFLRRNGHATDAEGDLFYVSFLRRLAARHCIHSAASYYVIMVPTLRCNLACTYCQVSRVSQNTRGYDWSPETVRAVIRYLDSLQTNNIKIEFQGGEPSLRLDILRQIHDFCERRFQKAEYVVCTNLHRFGTDERDFFELPNVFVSTSLDGDLLTHQRNRTKSTEQTRLFFGNLRCLINALGQEKVSALPTINCASPPDIDALIAAFANFGFRSIYLRPVNYQGFARKAHAHSLSDVDDWNKYYFAFLDRLIDMNFDTPENLFEEYYFKLCLHRVLRAGHDDHVDLRNPTYFGRDYIVIDYDGSLYPTDEARMVTRVGQIDLSVGDVHNGIAEDRVRQLNSFAFNDLHEDCIHCVYQPYCGVDVIDDISRYRRVDTRKLETWFCRRHIAIFDRIFSFIYSDDPKIRFSLLRWAGLPRDRVSLGLCHHDSAAS